MTGAAAPHIHELARGVGGWLSPAEGNLLYRLARNCRSGCIVEIGSYQGKSTTYLAAGSEAGSRVPVYAIDPHSGPHASPLGVAGVVRQMERAGLVHLIRPMVIPSQVAAEKFSEAVELLFIDGDHRLESVAQDWDKWVSKVIPGGFVAMHDTLKWSGPREIAEARLLQSGDFTGAGVVDSITFGRKRGTEDPPDGRLRQMRVILLKRMSNAAVRLPILSALKPLGSRVLAILQK